MADEYSYEELNEIEQLVKECCANFDNEYGCLPLDTSCYMLGIRFKDTPFCKYFEDAVLQDSQLFDNLSNRSN